MADEEVLAKLDLIQATLELAFSEQIGDARRRIRSDDINASLLDHTSDWIGSSALQAVVAKEVKKSERSVRDRLPDLVAQRALEVRGPEKRPEYRRAGLI